MNSYVNTPIILMCKFPLSKSELLTIGFTLKNSDGSIYVARSTTNVINLGDGSFSVVHTFTEPLLGLIVWDTGETEPSFAVEELNIMLGIEGDPLSAIVAGSNPPITRGQAIDKLYVPAYVGPVIVIPASPIPSLQRLYGSVKELGLNWAEGDEVQFTPLKDQIINGVLLKPTTKITLVNSDGNIVDPTTGEYGILVDKTAQITVEAKRKGGVGSYFTQVITITNDDSKDLSTY